MTINEEKQLRQVIREMVEEFVSNYYGDMDERKKKLHNKSKSSTPKKKSKDRDGKPGKESDERIGAMKNKRRAVLTVLKDKHVDCAPYAYSLWPKKARKGKKGKANARSQFYKCRDNKKNDNGDYYSFTDNEINHLYSDLSTIRK